MFLSVALLFSEPSWCRSYGRKEDQLAKNYFRLSRVCMLWSFSNLISRFAQPLSTNLFLVHACVQILHEQGPARVENTGHGIQIDAIWITILLLLVDILWDKKSCNITIYNLTLQRIIDFCKVSPLHQYKIKFTSSESPLHFSKFLLPHLLSLKTILHLWGYLGTGLDCIHEL